LKQKYYRMFPIIDSRISTVITFGANNSSHVKNYQNYTEDQTKTQNAIEFVISEQSRNQISKI
jgi:hypothetical protein